MESAITLQGGFSSPYFPRVESELRAVLPKGVPFTYVQATDLLARAERTLKPESIALGVFGGIAGLAALLIAGQVIGRRIRLNTDDLDVLRALGASPRMTIGDGLIGTLGAILMGTLLAGLVAVGLSPVGPLGPIGPLTPLALRVDWTAVSYTHLDVYKRQSPTTAPPRWVRVPRAGANTTRRCSSWPGTSMC